MRKINSFIWFLGLFSGLLLSACGGNDVAEVPIVIPTEEDEECCSLAEEANTKQLLSNYQEVANLSGQTVGKYTIKVYARKADLSVGYNDLWFAVEKTENGRHVKDVAFSDLSPLMDMGTMRHSTPVANVFMQVDDLPVYHTWVSLLMVGEWSLSFSYRIKESSGTLSDGKPTVQALPEGQIWLKSFKVSDDTYYLSLANPQAFQTGINTITAYISKRGADAALPYLPATETFTVDIYPTMPDMGNHTSPNNEALTRQADGSYQGQLNLTMTGTWDIHLTVRDADGNIVGGTESTGSEVLSELLWTITI